MNVRYLPPVDNLKAEKGSIHHTGKTYSLLITMRFRTLFRWKFSFAENLKISIHELSFLNMFIFGANLYSSFVEQTSIPRMPKWRLSLLSFQTWLENSFWESSVIFCNELFPIQTPTDVIQTVVPANKQRENPSFLWQFALSHARHFVVSEDEVKKH